MQKSFFLIPTELIVFFSECETESTLTYFNANPFQTKELTGKYYDNIDQNRFETLPRMYKEPPPLLSPPPLFHEKCIF